MIRFLVASIFLFSSCSSTNNNKSKAKTQDTITFEILAQNSNGGKTDLEFVVINDKKALNEIYQLIGEGRFPKLKTPSINFEQETVIALFLGEKTSGGYSISVKQILSLDDKINVTYKITAPKRGEMVTAVMTQPYCIIKMSKTLKEVVFKETGF